MSKFLTNHNRLFFFPVIRLIDFFLFCVYRLENLSKEILVMSSSAIFLHDFIVPNDGSQGPFEVISLILYLCLFSFLLSQLTSAPPQRLNFRRERSPSLVRHVQINFIYNPIPYIYRKIMNQYSNQLVQIINQYVY